MRVLENLDVKSVGVPLFCCFAAFCRIINQNFYDSFIFTEFCNIRLDLVVTVNIYFILNDVRLIRGKSVVRME